MQNKKTLCAALLGLSLSIQSAACGGDDGGGSGTGGMGGAGGGGMGGAGGGGMGGAGGGGVGGGGMGGTGGAAPAGDPTFTAIYNDLLASASVGNCMFSACHGGAPADGNAGLQMSPTDQAATYAALVNKPSYATGLCAGRTLVVPGQPDQSLLYQKLAGTSACGVQMPVAPLGMIFTPGQLEQVRQWIANGAMNDGGMPTAGAGGMGGMGGAAGTMGGMGGDGGMAGGGMGGDGGMSGGAFTLTSPSATEGMELPTEFRCVSLGGDTGPSPALMWSNAPAGTMSFAITFTDKSTGFSADYAHWTIFDIPAATTMLPEGVASGATTMPSPAKQSTNSAFLAPTNGYSGPCGTNTTPNPYEFKLWALDVATLPDVTSSSARDAVLTALEAHDVGTATLTVTSTAP